MRPLKGVGIDSEEKNSKDWTLGHSVLIGRDDKEDSVGNYVLGLLGGLHEVINKRLLLWLNVIFRLVIFLTIECTIDLPKPSEHWIEVEDLPLLV